MNPQASEVPTLLESMGMTEEDLAKAQQRGSYQCEKNKDEVVSKEELRNRLRTKLGSMRGSRQRTGKHSQPPSQKSQGGPSNTPATPTNPEQVTPSVDTVLNQNKLMEFTRLLKKYGSESAVASLGIEDEATRKQLARTLKGAKAKAINQQMLLPLLQNAMKAQAANLQAAMSQE